MIFSNYNTAPPLVTILMPIHNEENYIVDSLGAVIKQHYPSDRLEILIIDGMSDDSTRQIIEQMWDNRPKDFAGRLQILDNPAQVTPVALNIGLHRANGAVIILVGGHCHIAPDYVERCVAALQNTDAACVGGPMITVGETPIAGVIAQAQSSWFGVGGVAFRTGCRKASYVDTVAFGAYRREIFNKVGRFDEELIRNQDDEFNFRLTQAGEKIWFDPSIISTYYSRSNLLGLWKQYFNYGLYKVPVIQKRGAIPSWRHLVPASFVFGLVFTCLLALFMLQPLWLLGVTGPYAVVNLLVSLRLSRLNRSKLAKLSLTFLTLHVSYGIGFWQGLALAIINPPTTSVTGEYVHSS